MIYCTKCGCAISNDETKFCPSCGNPIKNKNAGTRNGTERPVNDILVPLKNAKEYFGQYQDLYDSYYELISNALKKRVFRRHPLFWFLGIFFLCFSVIAGIEKYWGLLIAFIVIGIGLLVLAAINSRKIKQQRDEWSQRILTVDDHLSSVYDRYPEKRYFTQVYTVPQVLDQLQIITEKYHCRSIEEAESVFLSLMTQIYRDKPDQTNIRDIVRYREKKNRKCLDRIQRKDEKVCALHYILNV